MSWDARLARAVEEFRINHRAQFVECSKPGWQTRTRPFDRSFLKKGFLGDGRDLLAELYRGSTQALVLLGAGDLDPALLLLLALLALNELPRAPSTAATASSSGGRVSDARLLSLALERFKSYDVKTEISLAPLTA